MPRTQEQNQEIREATQARLLETAMTLFARHGYAYTSIRRIADRAEVSLGLLYHYFENKESLLQAVFDNCIMIINQGFIRALEASNPDERLANILRYIFSALEDDPEFWGLFYSLRSQPAVMRVLGDDFRHWTAQLRELLTENLGAAGWPDPELEALILYSLIEGTIQQYLLDPDTYPIAEVSQRIVAEYSTPNES